MILFDKLKKYLLYLYIFYVIYTPVLVNSPVFDKYFLLYVLMLLMLTPYVLRRDKSLLEILGNRNVIFLMTAILLSSIYFTIIQFTSNIDIDNFMDLRLIQNNVINVLIIHAAIIIDKLRKRGFSKRGAFELLLKIGALQGIVCLLGLFFPLFKEMAIFLYGIAGGANPFVIESRIYGISSDYTFGTPIYHGLLAGLAVYEAIKNRLNRYYFYTILILISTFLNGRTGIVIFLLVATLSVVYLYAKKQEKKKIITVLGSIGVIIIVMINCLQYISPNTYKFVDSFIDDTKSLIFHQELTGNYKVLIEDSLRFPENEDFIFGAGFRVYDAEAEQRAGFRSDIGFVNDMYMGGVIFTLLLYLGSVYFLVHDSRDSKFLFLVIIIAIALANFKGEIFRSSIFMFLIIYVKLLSLTYDQRSKNI